MRDGAVRGGWYASVEALVLSRTKGTANIPVAFDTANNNNVVLTTHSVDFSTVTVPSYLLGYDFELPHGVRGELFRRRRHARHGQGRGQRNRKPVVSAGGLGTRPAADFSFSNQVTMNYGSRFSNAEFNVIKKYGCWNWLWGFRYVRS